MRKAVFLDKDGTIIQNIPYNIDFTKIRITIQAVEGLKLLQKMGYIFIIITNQSGVEKGYFSEQEFIKHIHYIIDMFWQRGIFITSYYYCPHDYKKTSQGYVKPCYCGKPKPGMIIDAAKEFFINLSQSWMIGDILNDIEAGNAAFVKTILINNGNETEWHLNEKRKPHYIVENFYQAAMVIKNIHE